MDALLQDLRFALRGLRRQPGFAATALSILAIGIGATTAIFSVVNLVLVRPLPYPQADRVVAVTNFYRDRGVRGLNVSAPDFHDWRDQSRSFEPFAYHTGGETSVTGPAGADYAWAIRVSPGFFDVFRVRPRIGRLLSPEEERPGGPLAAVVTDAYWRRALGADAGAIGQTLKSHELIFEIVGVLPPGFRFPSRADVYYAAATVPETTSRSGHNYRVVARLRDGVTLEQARGEMAGISARLEKAYPDSNEGKSAMVLPLHEILVGGSRATLYLLLAAVGLLLLIACANVANLLLVRAMARERELVVRAAVGAGRARLVRQLLTESLVLSLVAGGLGALVAYGGVAAVGALAPADLPRMDEIRVDGAVLLFAFGAALLSSLVFGLAPAVLVSRVRLVEGLRQSGKGSSPGAQRAWVRNAFAVGQMALAVVLVAVAALLARSLAALASVDMGFARDRILVLRAAVPVASFEEAGRASAFYRGLLPEARGVPEVLAAGAVTSLPTRVRSDGSYRIEGISDSFNLRSPQAVLNVVTPDYFRTMSIPVRAGRDFTDADRMDAPFVAIVNEALVRTSFGGVDPIGHRIQCGLDSLEPMTIVGVVGDVRTYGPSRPAQPEIYMPFEQHPGPASSMNLVVRTDAPNPLALADTLQRAIRARNPDVPVQAETMEMALEGAVSGPRFRTYLLGAFAGAALLLAVAGVYGVMAYSVSRRLPEIGVRVALGASPRDILRMVVGQGAALAGVGLAAGLVLALAASRAVEGLLFGVTGRDPAILAAVAGLVAAAALGACYVPGKRALRVEPMAALRAE